MRALIIVALVVLVVPSAVLAQDIPSNQQDVQIAQATGAGGVRLEGAKDADSLEALIVDLYAASVRIVGLAAFLMLLYAGVRRMMGHVQESNAIIMDAIIGTVLLLSSVVILNSINPDTIQQGGRVLDPDRFDPPGERGAPTGAGGTGAILPIIVQ